MQGPQHRQGWRHWRARIVWCVLLTLPFGGFASILVELLGPSHFHRQAHRQAQASATSMMSGWQDFRRAGHDSAPALMASGHSTDGHSALQRHRHSPADVSVVSLDGGASDGNLKDGASSFHGASLAWASGRQVDIRPPAPTGGSWPRRVASTVASRSIDPLERPPRA